jgi:hypothetical protein
MYLSFSLYMTNVTRKVAVYGTDFCRHEGTKKGFKVEQSSFLGDGSAV